MKGPVVAPIRSNGGRTQSMLSVLELSTNQAPVARDAPVNQSLRCAPPRRPRRRPAAAPSVPRGGLANVVGPDAPVRAVVVEDLADGLRLLAHVLDWPLPATHAARVANAGAGARAGAVERAAAAGSLALEVKLYERVRVDAVRRASALGL